MKENMCTCHDPSSFRIMLQEGIGFSDAELVMEMNGNVVLFNIIFYGCSSSFFFIVNDFGAE